MMRVPCLMAPSNHLPHLAVVTMKWCETMAPLHTACPSCSITTTSSCSRIIISSPSSSAMWPSRLVAAPCFPPFPCAWRTPARALRKLADTSCFLCSLYSAASRAAALTASVLCTSPSPLALVCCSVRSAALAMRTLSFFFAGAVRRTVGAPPRAAWTDGTCRGLSASFILSLRLLRAARMGMERIGMGARRPRPLLCLARASSPPPPGPGAQ
mmetsp:Transcript_43086/g.88160  ORF Transcript_43086/g.88160 Transcript_43086/m.88160 type:complete len:213 (+) Transcript_43086:2607-3245(+)